MAPSSRKPRQKLIDAALELFVSQGIANTTTRQIANLASVNEATLFRNFGNKYGLLQAVIGEAGLFEALETKIQSHLHTDRPIDLDQYALAFLEAIASQKSLLCSLVGEVEHYSPEFKAELTRTLFASNQRLCQLIRAAIPVTTLDDSVFTGLFHGLLLSYAVFRATNQVPEPWLSPEHYLEAVTRLFGPGLDSPSTHDRENRDSVQDLPKPVVHALLQQAKKQGAQEFALVYLLFGAGLTPTEICGLKQGDRLADGQQHVLTVRYGEQSRQVPVNQWILGKRYGSFTNNPLTRWLKGRKKKSEFIFFTEAGLGMTPKDIESIWEKICAALEVSYQIWQSAQTWQVEQLMRGISIENLSILSGFSIEQLQPLAQRAREKIALEQAIALDKKM